MVAFKQAALFLVHVAFVIPAFSLLAVFTVHGLVHGWSWSRPHGTDPADQLHPSRCIPIRSHYHPASSIATSGLVSVPDSSLTAQTTSGHALQASVPAAWCGGDHPLEHRLGFPDSHQNRHSVGRRPPLLQYNGRTASRLIPVDSQTRKHSHERTAVPISVQSVEYPQ